MRLSQLGTRHEPATALLRRIGSIGMVCLFPRQEDVQLPIVCLSLIHRPKR